MYPVGTGSAALQRRVRRGQTSAKAAEVEDLSGFSDFLPSPITLAFDTTQPTRAAAPQTRQRKGGGENPKVFWVFLPPPLSRGQKAPHYPHGRIHQLWNGSK